MTTEAGGSRAATTQVKSDRAADVALLGSRAQSTGGNPIQVRAEVRGLKEKVSLLRERNGVDAHYIGTVLARLWHMKADELLGFPSFVAFLMAELGISRSKAYEYIRVAAYATAAEAEWGVETCLAAASIVDLFKASAKLRRKFGVTWECKRIADLQRIAFTLPDGRSVQFSVGKSLAVGDVLALHDQLREQSGLDLGGAGSRAERAASQTLVDALRGRDEYAGVEARFSKKKGQKVLQLSVPEGIDLVKLAKLLTETIKRG